MEDMSKKTKRLEKENDSHKRKHEAMNQNIFKMAEERTKQMTEIASLKKREVKLSGIIKQMQQQGRGIPQGLAGTVENGFPEGNPNVGDSEYEDEDEYDEEGEDGEVSEDGEEYDEETEDELHQVLVNPPYGPEPPLPAPVAGTNGHRQ